MTTTTHTEPAAWIGCLSCYNAGTLRGKWITARQAADEADSGELITYAGQAEPATYPSGTAYARCVVCGGDEFDVFDTQHLPAGCRTLREFYENAEQLADLDDAGTLEQITALAGWLGSASLADLIDYNDDHYAGQYTRFQDFADEYADDNLLGRMAPDLAAYFDYEKFARDLAHDYYYDDATGHTWYSA